MKPITTLAIETSCDDTSIAIVSYDNKMFSVPKILAYSQVKDHQKFGGVVPEIASRLHSDKIISVLAWIGRDEIKKVDFISVTTHPWLPWSLLVWQSIANMLWEYFQKHVIWVNHIQWHIFSIFLERKLEDVQFPLAILTASWWHNDIYFVTKNWELNKKFKYKSIHHLAGFDIYKIWQTIDDASWEAFDKVSRMLGWPYPGWPRISQKAIETPKMKQEKHVFWSWTFFKRIRLDKNEYNFSFSWVKSQIYNFIRKYRAENNLDTKLDTIPDDIIATLAFEFQESVTDVLTQKLIKAGTNLWAKTFAICWWVSANKRRREKLNSIEKSNCQYIRPTKILYSTDNAAMIWLVGIMKFLEK